MSSNADLDASRKLAMEQLTDEERAAMADELSDDEKAVLKAIADDDDDDDDGDDVVAAAPAAKPAEDAPAAAVVPGDDGEDEIAPLPFKPQFKVDLPADLDDQLAALSTQEAELAQQMKDGEIEIADFMAKTKEIGKSAAKLEGLRDQAATFEEMNRQTAEQEWMWTIAQFKAQVKKAEGVDYAGSTDLDGDLDTFVKAIALKPENADKDFNWFLTEAHKRVKVLHGLGDKPPKKEDTPKPRKAASAAGVPVTLAVVPGGDGPGDVGNDEFADLDKLDGLEYETALAKMSKEQRDRYLQAA